MTISVNSWHFFWPFSKYVQSINTLTNKPLSHLNEMIFPISLSIYDKKIFPVFSVFFFPLNFNWQRSFSLLKNEKSFRTFIGKEKPTHFIHNPIECKCGLVECVCVVSESLLKMVAHAFHFNILFQFLAAVCLAIALW